MSVVASFGSADARDNAASELRRSMPDMVFANSGENGGQFLLTGRLTETAVTQVQSYALRQNMTTLHHRIHALGVAEPLIQQQGADRFVVQLSCVQAVAKDKANLGSTATLEIHMVTDSPTASDAHTAGKV